MSARRTERLSDFQDEWCQKLLNDPNMEFIGIERGSSDEAVISSVSNTFLMQSLRTDDTIPAMQMMRRRTDNKVHPYEYLTLVSLGSGLEGHRGVTHGGVNATLLDQALGMCAVWAGGVVSTATLTVEYKLPLRTPGVVLCRAWLTDRIKTKLYVAGSLEDAQGVVCTTAEALFLQHRKHKL